MSHGAAQPATTSPSPPRASSSFHFLAGLSTGTVSAFLLQPADLLKTRVQQSRSASLATTLRSIAAGPSAIRQLWRGTLPSIIRTGFGSALYFSTLNALRTYMARTQQLLPGALVGREGGRGNVGYSASSSSALPKLSNTANLATGAVARASAGFVLMPLTVIKVRFESSLYAYRSLWEAAEGIVRKDGVRGFFSGFGATAVRDAPYAGLYVVVYERMKPVIGALLYTAGRAVESDGVVEKMASGKAMSTSQSATTNFLSGIFAAGAATALTNPFDAVKTRLQLMPGRYGNMVRAVRMMLREEGLRSLFDGLGLRMGRKAISSALTWTLYEEIVRKAEKRWVGVAEEAKQKV